MAVRDDGDGFPADAEGVKRSRSLGGHGGSWKQRESERMGHETYLTMKRAPSRVDAATVQPVVQRFC